MPRIVGVDLPAQKRIDIALTTLYGIGRATASRILSQTQIDPALRAKELTEDQITRINSAVAQGFRVEGDLKRTTNAEGPGSAQRNKISGTPS
jgi:small subunit ribosomal protein S13